jgi:hypothetical protein
MMKNYNWFEEGDMDRKAEIITEKGNRIVKIKDIRFRGKRRIDWNSVEIYLRRYIGEHQEVKETGDIIYIGSDFPDEFSHSNYTMKIRGTVEKAKANATQGILELIEVAFNKSVKPNKKEKHNGDAKYGWYKYTSRFAIPVFQENGEVERYNVFRAEMLMRHSKNGKLYLYDVIEVKKEKETDSLFQPEDLTQ